MTGMRRRDFLRTTAIAGGGLLVAACAPGAVAPPGQPAASQPTQAAKPAARAGQSQRLTWLVAHVHQPERDGRPGEGQQGLRRPSIPISA